MANQEEPNEASLRDLQKGQPRKTGVISDGKSQRSIRSKSGTAGFHGHQPSRLLIFPTLPAAKNLSSQACKFNKSKQRDCMLGSPSKALHGELAYTQLAVNRAAWFTNQSWGHAYERNHTCSVALKKVGVAISGSHCIIWSFWKTSSVSVSLMTSLRQL